MGGRYRQGRAVGSVHKIFLLLLVGLSHYVELQWLNCFGTNGLALFFTLLVCLLVHCFHLCLGPLARKIPPYSLLFYLSENWGELNCGCNKEAKFGTSASSGCSFTPLFTLTTIKSILMHYFGAKTCPGCSKYVLGMFLIQIRRCNHPYYTL